MPYRGNYLTHYPITEPVLRWLEVILGERFGHAWHLSRVEEGLRLQLVGVEGEIIFDQLCDGFTQTHSVQACSIWDAAREGWLPVLDGPLPAPGLAELPSPLIHQHGVGFRVHYDILGLTYWMLARLEEIGRTDLDEHDRFPAASSHAYKWGYLTRPLVDEWLHVLAQIIERSWPGVCLKKHKSSITLSHDVDRPSRYGFASPQSLIRRMGGDIIRGDVKIALKAPWVRLKTKNSLHPGDPFNTFDWIMDVSERHGLLSAFNFICGQSGRFDGEYQIDHPAIRNLLRKIHTRGHEIGLHPSYDSFNNPTQMREELERLRAVCDEEGIHQKQWGGRMHYLRWAHPKTLVILNELGMAYDSTLTYADHPGFRCGTCFEYPGLDVFARRQLTIRIRPLIVMEASVISDLYMGVNNESDALNIFIDLKNKCKLLGGGFTMLWHNSELIEKSSNSKIYKNLLSSEKLYEN